MNNKPVAWIDEETGCFVYSQYDYEDLDEHGKDGLIPLYTHPVKEFFEDEPQAEELHEIMQSNAELTDEEIREIARNTYFWNQGKHEWSEVEFARAILRKASEKCTK